jgi:murein DD-endopeptidase MepM/ murein hydrolase activator NlpD
LSRFKARLVTYSTVAALVAATLFFVEPLPPRSQLSPRLSAALANPWREEVDSVGRGETIAAVLVRRGFPAALATELLRAAPAVDPRAIPVGMRITFGLSQADSLPQRVSLQVAQDSILHIERDSSGAWRGHIEVLPWQVDTMVVRGHVTSSLYDAIDAAAAELPRRARLELAWEVADIFEYRVDMSRDLQRGDSISVLVERRVSPQGAMRTGRVLAATLRTGQTAIHAIRHERTGERPRYYDQDGRSLASNFLRTPVAFRRISSVFGLRKHPILGSWRRHQGTDYAADPGTPVRSIGDGVVLFAGWRGGYGNLVEVRHPNGFVTRYGHLRGFSRGVRAGVRVSVGEVIGYVGMTGLATGPHLHFELLVNGVARNPHTALASKAGTPLPPADRPQFESLKSYYLALLHRPHSLPSTANNE